MHRRFGLTAVGAALLLLTACSNAPTTIEGTWADADQRLRFEKGQVVAQDPQGREIGRFEYRVIGDGVVRLGSVDSTHGQTVRYEIRRKSQGLRVFDRELTSRGLIEAPLGPGDPEIQLPGSYDELVFVDAQSGEVLHDYRRR